MSNASRATRDIDHELRRVDDAFAMLRPGKELDERLDDLLDGRAAPTPSIAPRAVVAVIAIGALAIAFVALRDEATPIAVAPAAAPVVVEQNAERFASAPVAPVERVAIEEDVRFIDVPMGRLEVRAPSTVDVRTGRAIVTSGSARLFERGKAPRTLLKGQSIAWKLPSTSTPEKSPPEKSPGIDDADIEAMLAQARAHEARGAYAAAADVLADLLARNPRARVADTVGFERASLLSRARNIADACATLQTHARKFPSSENAVDVAALRARLACR